MARLSRSSPTCLRARGGTWPAGSRVRAACDRGADDVEAVASVAGADVAGGRPFGESLLGLVVAVAHLEANRRSVRGGQQLAKVCWPGPCRPWLLGCPVVVASASHQRRISVASALADSIRQKRLRSEKGMSVTPQIRLAVAARLVAATLCALIMTAAPKRHDCHGHLGGCCRA
jgi:hypothetical protein